MKSRRYVLVVDDHEGIRRLLYVLLTGEGYVVKTASSGEEALRLAREDVPALVLLDVRMPGMGGFETLSNLLEIYPSIPVIMITAYTELHEVMEAQKAGHVKYFLKKPFDLNDVRNLVKKALMENSFNNNSKNA